MKRTIKPLNKIKKASKKFSKDFNPRRVELKTQELFVVIRLSLGDSFLVGCFENSKDVNLAIEHDRLTFIAGEQRFLYYQIQRVIVGKIRSQL